MRALHQRLIVKLLTAVMLAALFAGIGTTQQAQAAPGDSPVVMNTDWKASDIVPGKVLVKYKKAPKTDKRGASMQRSLIGPRLVSLTLPEGADLRETIAKLKTDPNVEYAEPVYKAELIRPVMSVQSDGEEAVTEYVYDGPESYMQYWGHYAMDILPLRAETTQEEVGEVTIAVIDTGIDASHPDLAGYVLDGYDFVNDEEDAYDDEGHGTHVAGIIGAWADSPGGYTGVAPGVKMLPVKVLDEDGYGDSEWIALGIEYAVEQGVDIINMSLGIPFYSYAVHDAIKQAEAAGILVLAASGNESNHWIDTELGQRTYPEELDTDRYAAFPGFPAALDEVVSVGAIAQLTEDTYTIADFSNPGNVDFVAPGVKIYSTKPDGKYEYLDGTSMATPYAAGVAALIKANHPILNGQDLKSILTASASRDELAPLPGDYAEYLALIEPFLSFAYYDVVNLDRDIDDEVTYGSGLLNASAAYTETYVRINYIEDDLDTDASVTMDVYMIDLNDYIVDSDAEVELVARSYDEGSMFRTDDEIITVQAGVLEEGVARLTIDLGEPSDAYSYYIYAKWQEDGIERRSNVYRFVLRPEMPTSSLESGTYAGTRTVMVTSATPGAEIYYELYPEDIEHFEYGIIASGETIEVTETALLSIFSFKNGVNSDNYSQYLYEIEPVPATTPGGGGSVTTPPGNSIVVTPQQPSTDGVVETDKSKLLEQLEKGEPNIVIDVPASIGPSRTVKLDADVLRKAAELGKPIQVKQDGLVFNLPPGLLSSDVSGTIELKTTHNSTRTIPGAAGKPLSKVYDFTLSVAGQTVSSFAKPIGITFTVDTTGLQHKHQVGVYTYNEQTSNWDYVGGKWSADGEMKAQLHHFSEYAVLEANKTFQDLKGHWARTEIEALAARQIVTGATDAMYAPRTVVTRAQMAALLARTLRLDQSDKVSEFTDVSSTAWYAGAIQAVKEAGLAKGITDTTFDPNGTITREQLAVLAVNAYLHLSDKTLADIAITQEVKYSDEGLVSPWARQQVRTASALGLMEGFEGGEFDPKASVNRDQAAVILYRLLEMEP